MRQSSGGIAPYPESLAGSLLAAREAVMAPIRPHLRDANVTEQQWRVLRVLADAEALDASTIARRALLYAPTVTRILRELVERGLIRRNQDPADARRSIIAITAQGEALVTETTRHTRVLLDDYAASFGRERLDAFIAEARALAQALDRFQPED